MNRIDRKAEFTPVRYRPGFALETLDGLGARRIGRGPKIEREARNASDDVGCARPGLDSADGRDHGIARVVAGDHFRREDHFGRPRERVAPQVHRYGSGVAGLARNGCLQAGLSNDRGNDAEGLLLYFENRTLLDVHLDEGGCLPARDRRGLDFRRVLAVLTQRLFACGSG